MLLENPGKEYLKAGSGAIQGLFISVMICMAWMNLKISVKTKDFLLLSTVKRVMRAVVLIWVKQPVTSPI